MNTSMSSRVMVGGRQKLSNVLDDNLSKDLMNAGRFCFSCEQIFASRKFVEEHMCPAASHICSCGTEFAVYEDMLEHSTTHEPGHQVLDHETIRKRRIEKHQEEEEKLKRLQSGEVVWEAPKSNSAASFSSKPALQRAMTSARLPQPAHISKVPALYPQTSSLQNPIPSPEEMQDIFSGVGAPTVDLWPLYQPVVLLQTVRKFNRFKPYSCGKCGQCFVTKKSLICHNSTHVTDKVCGCIGCGTLLSSKKMVPRFHYCNSPITATKLRIITARPLNAKKLSKASIYRGQYPSPQRPLVTSPIQLKGSSPSTAGKISQAFRVPSALQLKNQNLGTFNKSIRGFQDTPSLQWKSQNSGGSKPYISVSIPSKSPSLMLSSKSGLGHPNSPSVQLKVHTNSTSKGFHCRVCHLPFETAQLLQRHKCAKAQEFMARHVRAGKSIQRQNRVTPVVSPDIIQINGDEKLGGPASGNINKNQVMDKDQSAVPINVDLEDDCYIVENEPDKPAEMIYQVTSSVPITT